MIQSLEAIKVIFDNTTQKKDLPLKKWSGYNIWLKHPDKFTKMLNDFSQYDIVPKDKIYKVKVLLDSFSGEEESDICDLLHQWVFSWYKTAIASVVLKKLESKLEKKSMKDLVDFALTYETIRPEPVRIRAPEDTNNRDLGSSMSMNVDYIN